MHQPIDLDAYFKRICYDGSRLPTLSTLNAIMLAHVQHIPFENLDVLLKRSISLDAASLQQKILVDRRGGYCFEQNGLFLLVLEALGFDVTPVSARVRIALAREFTPPRTHMFVRVIIDGESWLADVGVGGFSLTSAICLKLDTEQTTPHEPRRIIREGNIYFHQVCLSGQWEDVCEFTLEAMPLIDREVANWYTSASPQSHFKNRMLIARAAPEGQRITLLNDVFSIRDASGVASKQTITSKAEFLQIIAEHFGLYFAPDIQFHLPGVVYFS